MEKTSNWWLLNSWYGHSGQGYCIIFCDKFKRRMKIGVKNVYRHSIFCQMIIKWFLTYSITSKYVQHVQYVSELLTKHGSFSKLTIELLKSMVSIYWNTYNITCYQLKPQNGFYSQRWLVLKCICTRNFYGALQLNSQIDELYLQTYTSLIPRMRCIWQGVIVIRRNIVLYMVVLYAHHGH
jgi:hypothetical protein